MLIKNAGGCHEFKPSAGSAVFYRTGDLHEVCPITRGVRLACVGWIQSFIRRGDQRELLYDLERLRTGVPNGENGILFDKTIGNLIRMWGE
ncbi:2OG-Fe(II) oxygenase [Pacificimonas sp. ICDLI1SI03]